MCIRDRYNESPYPHSANDTYANMEPVFVYNVAKAALGARHHFSTADISGLSTTDCPPERMLESLKIFPNPAKDLLQIQMINLNNKDFTFMITALSGRSLITSQNNKNVNVSELSSGIYL